MPIETYQDLPNATNEEVIEFLRDQIIIILKKGKVNRRIIIAAFNEILNEIKRRMK